MSYIAKSPWVIHYDGSSCNGCDIEVLACLTPMYDVERTMCDLVRNRNSFEINDFNSALKAYSRKKEKNLTKLFEYAKIFRVERLMRTYMEVLL